MLIFAPLLRSHSNSSPEDKFSHSVAQFLMDTRKVVAIESFSQGKGITKNKIKLLSYVYPGWEWDWPHKKVQTGKNLATVRSQTVFSTAWEASRDRWTSYLMQLWVNDKWEECTLQGYTIILEGWWLEECKIFISIDASERDLNLKRSSLCTVQ